MARSQSALRLSEIVEAIDRLRDIVGDASFEALEGDWQRQWLIERGLEIISEASRRLPESLKVRYPEIPWQKVAGIGNVLRHDYGNISAPLLWKVVKEDLPVLARVCREALGSNP
jgi:uncharacterized protein with HEPN domain